VTATEPNEAERRRWNDPAWVVAWFKRERLTTAVTEFLLADSGLRPGESVLDVGTGGGVAALAAAELVAPATVVGADISTALVEVARRRAEERKIANASFVVADVQLETVPGGPFDCAISQFGVMFFDEPQTAFTNIRSQLVSGGRLAFVCWQPPARNPWFPLSVIAACGTPPPPPAPGKSPTNPFTLSDPEHTTGLLEATGWSNVHHTAHERVVVVDRDAVIDVEALAFFGVPADKFQAAEEAAERHYAPLTRDDGRIDAPLAFYVFTATV
jgi:SAM-dependent methyltransferase